MKIGLDLDAVVCDYDPWLVRDFNQRFQTNYDPYNISKECVYDIREHSITNGKEHINDIVDYHIEMGVFRNLDPVKGALDGIKKLKKYDHSIHILTWRKGVAQEDTIHWLNKYKVNYDSISFGQNKGEMGKLLGVHAVIDDNVKCIDNILDSGLVGIIFTTPFNLYWGGKIYTPEKGAWVRAEDWKHISHRLLVKSLRK